MVRLTFDCIRKIVESKDFENKNNAVVQFISAKVATPEDKVFVKGTVSWGNYSIISIIPGNYARETKAKGNDFDIKEFDIVQFNDWYTKETGGGSGKGPAK